MTEMIEAIPPEIIMAICRKLGIGTHAAAPGNLDSQDFSDNNRKAAIVVQREILPNLVLGIICII